MKRLHLLVGGLHPEALADFPHLARLVARGRVEDAPADTGHSAALARLFGIDARDLPAIALAAEGIDPGADAWFRADPVHLLAGMHSLTLFDSRHFQLATDEAAALIAALNAHFAGEIEFLAPHPLRWYARFRRLPDVEVPPLDQIAGAAIAPDQIAGPDARELQRAAMEIQMLLHGHPVNDAREERNEATVNGIWFWGGGTYRKPAASFDRVLADDFPPLALAGAAGIPAGPLADHRPGGRTLAVLNLDRQHDRDWFEPALRGLQKGQMDEVRLTLTGPQASRRVIDRWRALRFWRNG